MERTIIHRQIQGGGTGQGFKPPPQLLGAENRRFHEIVRDLLMVSYANRSSDSQKDYPKQEVWVKALKSRIVEIQKRKKLQISFSQELSSPDSRNQQVKTTNNQLILSSVDRSLQVGNTQRNFMLVSATNEIKDMIVPVKFIPGLPKTINECVLLWRKGTKDDSFKPVRLFEKGSMRKKLVKNYSNSSWVKGGQKSAYHRIKDVISFVHEYAPLTCNIWEEGDDEVWKQTVETFSKENQKHLSSLSVLISHIRKNK